MKKQAHIAVIMASYLGEYEGAATQRIDKFRRAVLSFQLQKDIQQNEAVDYQNKSLIIVSHGCSKTIYLYKRYFALDKNIYLLNHGRWNCDSNFKGSVRQMGIDYAIKKLKADVITYLDTDDYIMQDHLMSINQSINGYDWIYYNDQLLLDQGMQQERLVYLKHGSAGTSAISHKPKKEFSWTGCDGYGHDWAFIERLKEASSNYTKANLSGYVVCHNPNLMDN